MSAKDNNFFLLRNVTNRFLISLNPTICVNQVQFETFAVSFIFF